MTKPGVGDSREDCLLLFSPAKCSILHRPRFGIWVIVERPLRAFHAFFACDVFRVGGAHASLDLMLTAEFLEVTGEIK